MCVRIRSFKPHIVRSLEIVKINKWDFSFPALYTKNKAIWKGNSFMLLLKNVIFNPYCHNEIFSATLSN